MPWAFRQPLPRPDVTVHWEETYDGVTTSQLSWQLGFGPRTTGWLMRPAGASGPLPGVLALHCHGGNKFGGADRLVELPQSHPSAVAARAGHYDGRALATEVARPGFAVLAHDTFAWGSRRFDLSMPPWRTAAALEARKSQWREAGVVPSEADLYNAAAGFHEDTVAKAAGLLGTSLAGMVAHDDLAALDILRLTSRGGCRRGWAASASPAAAAGPSRWRPSARGSGTTW